MTDAKKRRPLRRFLRIYFDDLERDYPAVWFDPTCLSTFVRLLSLAEKAWPSSPEMPLAIRQADLDILQREGLVTVQEHDRYTMKGWKKERATRAKAGKAGSTKRWKGDAIAMQTHMQTQSDRNARASSSFSSSESVPTKDGVVGYPVADSETDCLDTYHSLTRFRPWGIWSGDKLLGAAREYGDPEVSAALRAAHADDSDKDTLMERTFARLAKDADRIKRAKVKAVIVKPVRDEAAYQAERRRLSEPGATA